MRKEMAAIGLSVLAICADAQAQRISKQSRLAAVDASGRILLLDRVGLGADAPTATAPGPCPAATAMSAEEAKVLVARIAKEENFYPELVQAVAKTESHYDAGALSDKGAVGLMQLLPETAVRFKVDLCNPADNVRGGIRFLRALLERYKNTFFVLAAYNAGEEAVAKSHGVPPYPETVRFVAQVINDVYGWPGADAPLPGAADALADARPDLIEPKTNEGQTHPAVARPRARPEWSDGFVMHID